MAKYKTFGFVLPIVVAITALFAVPRPQDQTKLSPTKSRRKVEVNHFPIVEFSSLETKDAKRRARAEKRDKSHWNVHPDAVSDSTVILDSIDFNLQAFPTKQAAAVVIGTVTDAQAYLSNDKTGIYSVFVVLIGEVLKNPGKLAVGSSIEAEREGGRVKFPSGRMHLYMISEQDLPRVGRRYVLFLAETDIESVFEIITGYEIREASVYPLDDLPQSRPYESITPLNFMNELRMKLANP